VATTCGFLSVIKGGEGEKSGQGLTQVVDKQKWKERNDLSEGEHCEVRSGDTWRGMRGGTQTGFSGNGSDNDMSLSQVRRSQFKQFMAGAGESTRRVIKTVGDGGECPWKRKFGGENQRRDGILSFRGGGSGEKKNTGSRVGDTVVKRV